MKSYQLSIVFFLMTFGTINAQWETKEYVDEFGDKTGKKYEAFVATGTFTNSATENADASYAFIKDDETLTIKVYEYKSSLATSIENTFETVKIKQPDDEIVTIKNVFFTKSGSLFFNEKEYNQIVSALEKSGQYTMIFDRSGKYSKSSYKIKFEL